MRTEFEMIQKNALQQKSLENSFVIRVGTTFKCAENYNLSLTDDETKTS